MEPPISELCRSWPPHSPDVFFVKVVIVSIAHVVLEGFRLTVSSATDRGMPDWWSAVAGPRRLQHSTSSAPLQHPEHLLLVDVLLVLHPLWTADEGAYTPGICGVCRVKSVCLRPKTWSDFVSQVCWFPLWAFARSFVFWQVLPRGGREVSRSYILRPYGPFRFQFQSRVQFRSIALVLYNVLLVCC